MAEQLVHDDVFGDDYLHFYSAFLTEEVSDRQAACVAALIELRAGTRILDVPCGHGRISNRLAALGAEVTGVDKCPLFIERATEDARARGVHVAYHPGDMRDLSPFGTHDVVLNWFTAFGYFDDATNRDVLRQFHAALVPGGLLVLEMQNIPRLMKTWLPSIVHERGEDLLIDRHTFDPVTSRLHTNWGIWRDGKMRTCGFRLRLYMPTELRAALESVGFSDIRFVQPDGAPLTADSPRMVALARR